MTSAVGAGWLIIGLCLVGACETAQSDKSATATLVPAMPADKIAAASAAPDVVLGRRLMMDAKKDAETLAAFTRAANEGNAVAEAYLGYLTYMGHGTRQDDQAAAQWYQRAAEQGLIDGELRLGLMYAAGRDLMDSARSLPKDNHKALHWLEQAAAQGSWTAADRILEIQFMADARNGHLDEVREIAQEMAEKNDPYAIHLLCNSYQSSADHPAEKKHWCDLRDQLSPYATDYDHWHRLMESDEIPMPRKDY